MSSVCMSTLLRKYKPCFLYSKPMLPPPYKTTKTVLPNNFIFRTHYSQRNNNNNSTQHTGLNKLRLYKGILALCLFSGTLGLAWRIKKERGARLKVLLEDCVRIPMDHQLFGAEVSAYRYNGHVFPGIMITSGLIKELQDFQFTPDDIIVASYPKAGTTWVQEIVYMLTHDCLPSDHTSPVLETRFPYLEYPYPGWRSLAGQEGRRWVKTHLPLHLLPHSFTQCGPKLIYISRNPRDTAGILALCLFSGTLGLAWRIKKERGARLKVLLEDCVRIPMDHQLFGAEVSAYRYNGHVFPGIMITSGLIKELQDFQFTPDDIIVASYPKAGTTWVQEIVYMLTHDCLPSDHTSPVLETRFPYLEYPYPGWRSLAGQEGRRWVKTHLPLHLLPHSFTQCGPKLIYISRNPRDTAVSYYYFMQLLTQCSYKGTFSQFIHMFVNDVCMYSPFFSHVLGYWNNRHQPNILFITYEQLHHNPKKVIKEIADFLEISVSPDDIESIRTCTSFTNMTHNTSVNYQHWKEWGFAHKDKGNFLRKGEVGNWKSHLNEEQVLMFEEWEQKHLKNTDLKFIYEEQKQEEEQEQPT
ncbi:hypothetical protein Pmani_000219 [Petrolisthes manimaculis]|uniref:Sulfotransferase domain-containing protein n=1 Tax=Petrolisthes manimaculis TaxID=1843537 RepID=A0AAE1UML2_9EUCA|nr:hypothetical protein Pmani_000219 [Petrolisthes manimaculis]